MDGGGEKINIEIDLQITALKLKEVINLNMLLIVHKANIFNNKKLNLVGEVFKVSIMVICLLMKNISQILVLSTLF